MIAPYRASRRRGGATPIFDGTYLSAYNGIDTSFGTWPSPSGSNISDTTDPAGSGRPVIKLALHENDKDTASNTVRVQARSVGLGVLGQSYWLYDEVWLPTTFPDVATDAQVSSPYLLLNEPYAEPFDAGSPPWSLNINVLDGAQKLNSSHDDNGPFPWQPFWKRPLVKGQWLKVAHHFHLSTDPAVGWMEVWYATKPNPLAIETLVDGTTRRYFSTVEPNRTGGTMFYINQYRRGGMPAFVTAGLATLYHGSFKLWAGALSVSQIDPDVS